MLKPVVSVAYPPILDHASFRQTCASMGLLDPPAGESQNLWVGFSGGIDSTVLLRLMAELFDSSAGYRLCAVHINHRINPHADSWQQHCAMVCRQLAVDFQAIQLPANAALITSSNLEEKLRLARIKIWKQLISANDTLWLGHNLDDQTENFLLRLFRGAGLRGLASMQPINYWGNIKVVRPLLAYSRHSIVNYAQVQRLVYIEDDSNYDRKFARNFIRQDVLPLLSQRWPAAVYRIGSAANQLQQVNGYLSQVVTPALQACCGYVMYYCQHLVSKRYLSLDRLLLYPKLLQQEILREFIIMHGVPPPTSKQLGTVFLTVVGAKIDSRAQVMFGNYVITKHGAKLYLYSKQQLTARNALYNPGWANKLGDITIYYGACFNTAGLGLRKKIFQRYQIPFWQRQDYPVVFRRNRVVAVLGLWHQGI